MFLANLRASSEMVPSLWHRWMYSCTMTRKFIGLYASSSYLHNPLPAYLSTVMFRPLVNAAVTGIFHAIEDFAEHPAFLFVDGVP
jgi:hypothetical protein